MVTFKNNTFKSVLKLRVCISVRVNKFTLNGYISDAINVIKEIQKMIIYQTVISDINFS